MSLLPALSVLGALVLAGWVVTFRWILGLHRKVNGLAERVAFLEGEVEGR